MRNSEIDERESKLIEEYGFVQSEIKFIMKHKSSLILDQDDASKLNARGLNVLRVFFCDKYHFDMDLVRGLIVKYPFILSKTESSIEKVFTTLNEYGFSNQEAMKYIYECPKLISVNLDANIKEAIFLFDIYHKMDQDQVFEIFRAFPYLFCVESFKLKRFLGEFKKYKLT